MSHLMKRTRTGRLPWDDIDYQNPLFPSSPSPAYQKCVKIFDTGMRSQPWSMQISCDIYVSLMHHSIPTKNIRVINYTTSCFEDDGLKEDCAEWHKEAVKIIFPLLMRRMDMQEKEIGEVVGGYLEECEALGERGRVFPVPLTSVVARK